MGKLRVQIPAPEGQIFEECENENDKKNIDHPERGFEPQIFSNFPAHDLNFHVKSGTLDQIKTSF